MPLTIDQYAEHLETRQDLSWPAAPTVERPKARAHLVRLPDVRAVTWSVYGTLLNIYGGELLFEHPQAFIMEVALEKTIQEFKMWQSMSRKPGKPSEYMKVIYNDILSERRLATGGGEKHPEIAADKIWERIVKRLMKNEYLFDASLYGSLDDFSRKVAFFFHKSLQDTVCYTGAAVALEHVSRSLGVQGILGDGQCFTMAQLGRALAQQNGQPLDTLVSADLRVLSWNVGAKKPSETLFAAMLERLQARGIEATEVLHVGSDLTNDVQPAKKLGMKTALFAGDKTSIKVEPELWKKPECRPEVLLTDLEQISSVVGT